MIYATMRLLGLGLVIYGISDISTPPEIYDWIVNNAGGRWRYFTYLGLYLTISTLVVGTIKRSMQKFTTMLSFLSWLHSHLLTVTFPIEILISVMYWSLLLQNERNFKRDQFLNKRIQVPLFCDVCQHFMPLISLLLEMQDTEIIRCDGHFVFYFVLGVIYFGFCTYLNKLNNTWPYPFLERMSAAKRSLVFVFSVALVIVAYMATIYGYTKLKTKKKVE